MEAAQFRRRAAIARAGEPLNRVVAMVEDHAFEMDELTAYKNGRVQFVFERNRTTLKPAAASTQQGEKLAEAGHFDESLEHFRTAAQADQFDPHARYAEGLTFLHLRRYADAIESYEATEGLAPGWFYCRADLWLARQLATGALTHEDFQVLRSLEDAPQSPEEKLRLAERTLAAKPKLALLHYFRGKALVRLNRRPDAEGAFREGLALVGEPHLKTRLLLELGVAVEPEQERRHLLLEARELNGDLVAAAMAYLALRQ